MHIQSTMKPIDLELVARKFASIRNYECPELLQQVTEQPRLLHAMLYLQDRSMRPGGIGKFVEELLAEFPEHIGTRTMVNLRNKRWTLEEKVAVRNEMPPRWRPHIDDEGDTFLAILSDATRNEVADMKARDRKVLESGLKDFDRERAVQICRRAALTLLPEYFAGLCTEQYLTFTGEFDTANLDQEEQLTEWEELTRSYDPDEMMPSVEGLVWYFQDVIGALFKFMDRSAVAAQQRLASTAVVKKVFATVDEVLETCEPRMIRGNTRFGKTESMRAVVDVHPGRLRYVAVPPGNSLRDLLLRIAEAMGIDTTYGSAIGPLRAKIEYILRHTGLVLIFDEGAWLIPENYSRSSQPPRMNWLRSVFLDRGVPVVVAVTPQWFDDRLTRYVKDTHYAMEQFTGRCVEVELPETLDKEDVIRVAAVHFPELKKRADLLEIGAEASDTGNYLKAIEQIAKHARYRAKRESVPFTMDLVRAAMTDLFPRPQMKPNRGGQSAQVDAPTSTSRVKTPTCGRRLNGPLNGVVRGVQATRTATNNREPVDCGSTRNGAVDAEEANLVSV